jgi:hypothetical protein
MRQDLPRAAPAAAPTDPEEQARMETDLAKRHRVSPAIVREIIRLLGTSERGAVEREIKRSKARR